MTQTITRLFDTYAAAENAVAELERMGLPQRDISLLANNSDRVHDHRGLRTAGSQTAGEAAANDAGDGAAVGGVAGAVGGVLAGLGMLAIPGLGPVVAAGWLASAATGAAAGVVIGGAAGGLVGALTHSGVSAEEAQVYAEGVRRGGSLVSVRVADDRTKAVESVLGAAGPVDVTMRGQAYRKRGWREFNERAAPYTRDDLAGERSRHAARSSPKLIP